MNLLCGAANVSINPPTGTLLAGYMAERSSIGVHDPIYAKVLYIESVDTPALMISLDLVGVDLTYVKELRKRLNEEFGIAETNIFIHATHTHSGPGGIINEASPIWKAFYDIWMPYNQSLVEEQYSKIIYAAKEAIVKAEESTLRFSNGTVEGIAANRISPEREYQPKLNVIEIMNSLGKKIILYNFACHPTILHDDNLLVSADYPGFTCSELESQEDIEMAIFFNGPSGDISTRFTRNSSSFDEVSRIGNILADQIKLALTHSKKLEGTGIQTKVIPFELGIRKMKDEDLLKEELQNLTETFQNAKKYGLSIGEKRTLESKIEGITASLKLAKKIEGISTIQTEVQILKVGELCFASIPGEAFYETGKEVLESINARKDTTLLIGNTNDYIGYIVPSHYYEEGSYEASMTLLEKGSVEKIRDLLIDHIGGM